jgi:putative Mg2+ transporter-C (MgtC) family protein
VSGLAPTEFLLRLLVALLLGLVIGLEREFRSQTPSAAGMRTLAIVSMGSALFTLISAYGFIAFTGALYGQTDPSRIAAQIVSGIGFLGAGAILLHKRVIHGLTTAAAVWATAAIGMASGLGFYVESVGATVLALATLEALRPLETRLFPRRQQIRIHLRLKSTSGADPMETIRALLREFDVSPRKLVVSESARGPLIEVEFSHRQMDNLLRLVQRLRTLPAVSAIRTEINAPGGLKHAKHSR